MIRVVIYGVGVIGGHIARLILEKRGFQIVGAIDVDPKKVGKDLGELLGLDRQLGVLVSDDIEGTLSKANAQVAVHTTSSYLETVYPQIEGLVRHGVSVVSTCEELSHPYATNPELAKRLDELAKSHGVTVLGTGVNPGFMMDTLVITLTGVCQKVDRIYSARVIDAARRRVPFQRKIGVGLTLEEFEEKIRRGGMGHVGLRQSIRLIADALGWELDKVVEGPVEPVIAQNPVESHGVRVEAGRVAGVRQRGYGIMNNEEVIVLDMQAYVGADDHDAIRIEGVPPINMEIRPGVHGDKATAAMVVNSIPKVLKAPPGVVTMKDLPIPSAILGAP